MGNYNLIDEKWLPTSEGLKSIKDIFTDASIESLGGNPAEKICALKLLAAIAQAAATPEDDYEWKYAKAAETAEKCLEYLDKWHDKFYLYSDEPFLQMPVKAAEKKPLSAIDPEIASGNTTVLFGSQKEKEYSDREKAMLILRQAGFAFAGKKVDNSVNLSKSSGYQKGKSGKPGPFVGSNGYLHSFLLGKNLQETIWLNMFSKEAIEDMHIFEKGVGLPPWEKMPEGEDCPRARELKSSFIGKLVPLCRFCLIEGNNIHYTEGITYPTHKEGGEDISVTLYNQPKDTKALWADTGKKPWRNLTGMLSFLGKEKTHSCPQIVNGFRRARKNCDEIGIWAGGLKLSSNAGEQYASGNDDYVESVIKFSKIDIGEDWYAALKDEMQELEHVSKILFKSVKTYADNLKAFDKAPFAVSAFWESCEKHIDDLLKACGSGKKQEIWDIRKKFAENAYRIFDSVCAKDTARQITEWAKTRPNLSKYLSSGGQQ